MSVSMKLAPDGPTYPLSVDGFAPLYLASGIVSASAGPRFFVAQVTTNASGVWSLDLTPAAFPTVAYPVGTVAICSGEGNQQMFQVVVKSVSKTALSGTVVTPTGAVLGSLPLVLANKAVSFNIFVVGW